MTEYTGTTINAEIKQVTLETSISNINMEINSTPVEVSINVSNNTAVQTSINDSTRIEASVTSGARGKSAYEIWLEEGHTGSEEDFLTWLKGDSYYAHNQIISDDTWVITHNLGKYPSVTVVDSAGTWVIGEVDYIDSNQLIVSFTATFAGKAYLN